MAKKRLLLNNHGSVCACMCVNVSMSRFIHVSRPERSYWQSFPQKTISVNVAGDMCAAEAELLQYSFVHVSLAEPSSRPPATDSQQKLFFKLINIKTGL